MISVTNSSPVDALPVGLSKTLAQPKDDEVMTSLAPAAAEVVGWFKRQLHEGELSPGGKLPSERGLAEHLGVSRLPLREGLKWLQARGLVTIHHGRGAFVGADADASVIADALLPLMLLQSGGSSGRNELMSLWELIEPPLAAAAADSCAREPASEALAERFLASVSGKVADGQSAADVWQLHAKVVSLAGNRLLEVLHQALGMHIQRWLGSLEWSAQRVAEQRRLGLAYAQAVLTGNSDAARQAALDVIASLRREGEPVNR